MLSLFNPSSWFKSASIPIASKPTVTTVHSYDSGVRYCAQSDNPSDCSVRTTAALRSDNTISGTITVHDTTFNDAYSGSSTISIHLTSGKTFQTTFTTSDATGNDWLIIGRNPQISCSYTCKLPAGVTYKMVANITFMNVAYGPATSANTSNGSIPYGSAPSYTN